MKASQLTTLEALYKALGESRYHPGAPLQRDLPSFPDFERSLTASHSTTDRLVMPLEGVSLIQDICKQLYAWRPSYDSHSYLDWDRCASLICHGLMLASTEVRYTNL